MHTEAVRLIAALGLKPHPEGGFYRETWRSALTANLAGGHGGPAVQRPFGTAIYFLLAGGGVSRIHRLKADEIWHLYAGGPLSLHLLEEGRGCRVLHLGYDVPGGPAYQAAIPAGCWFGAFLDTTDAFALVGCTLAPGFDFEDFELGDRARLMAAFPDQEKIIRRLT